MIICKDNTSHTKTLYTNHPTQSPDCRPISTCSSPTHHPNQISAEMHTAQCLHRDLVFYFWQYLKFWLILLSILRHMQTSIVCYCLYNVWIVVSWLFICDVEAWLIQIPIFELKYCIWALILLKVEIVVICQFLLKISVSRINFHIKSPYIVKLPQCYWSLRPLQPLFLLCLIPGPVRYQVWEPDMASHVTSFSACKLSGWFSFMSVSLDHI